MLIFRIIEQRNIFEQTFSVLNYNKNLLRTCVCDEPLKAVIRISTRKSTADIQNISNAKKLYFSHYILVFTYRSFEKILYMKYMKYFLIMSELWISVEKIM